MAGMMNFFPLVCVQKSLMASVIDNLPAHHELDQSLCVGNNAIHSRLPLPDDSNSLVQISLIPRNQHRSLLKFSAA